MLNIYEMGDGHPQINTYDTKLNMPRIYVQNNMKCSETRLIMDIGAGSGQCISDIVKLETREPTIDTTAYIPNDTLFPT
jgi:hypothetical protein